MIYSSTIDPAVAQSSLLEAQSKTDVSLPNKWLLLPIAVLFDWTILGTLLATDQLAAYGNPVFLLGLLIIIGLTFSFGSGYVVYALVNRRNKHFARAEAFLATSVEYLRSKIPREDVRAQILVNSAERDLFVMVQEGHERSSILWGLLSTIPYIGPFFTIVMLQLMSGDYKKHAAKEGAVIEDITTPGKGPGIQGSATWQVPHQSSDTTESIMLAIAGLTLSFAYSLYLIYLAGEKGVLVAIPLWLNVLGLVSIYSAIRSPQPHFNSHRNIDERVTQVTKV